MLGPVHCGPPYGGRPFSRSYGAVLPSSLAVLPPPALGFSPRPPVSACGTGPAQAIAAFPGGGAALFATASSLCRAFHSRLAPSRRVPAFLLPRRAGIFTCCPSDAPSGLSLGPGFPREDELYPGNLGHSARRIRASVPLLIPAFSLLIPPPPLAGRLRRL